MVQKEKKEMKEMLLRMALSMFMDIIEEMFTVANIRKYGDKLFDLIEDFVKDTETSIDDATVLPIIKALRKALNIPDND